MLYTYVNEVSSKLKEAQSIHIILDISNVKIKNC